MSDLIDRQKAIDAILNDKVELTEEIKAIGSTELFKTLNMTCDRHVKMLMELPTAEPQECKTEKALRLLLDWAIECDFGYDNIPEEYEKYKDDIDGMSYTDGLIYIARMEVDNEGTSSV